MPIPIGENHHGSSTKVIFWANAAYRQQGKAKPVPE
jgi:hypothetical protein